MSTVGWKDVRAPSEVPVVFLHHFTAVLDDWDGSNALHLDDATLQFVESAGGDEAGISRIDVATSERALIGEETHILGVAVRFVGAA